MSYQTSFKVLPAMCSQQQQDLQRIIAAADEIGAAASSVSAQGGQGYERLFEARDQFKTMVMAMAKNYRFCVEEDS